MLTLEPLTRADVGTITGPGYVAKLWLTFPGWFWAHWEPERPVDQRVLKTLIVNVYLDGAEQPQISAPVGDLFGIGLCRMASFAANAFGMSSGGFYLNLPMPFRSSLRIEVRNVDPDFATDVFCNVLYQRVDELPDDVPSLHGFFHTGRQSGSEPLLLAELTGSGRYLGCTLSCQGERPNYLSYLEAPEHVFIDDNWTAPQIVGTGLEDYFLGGWYFREGPFIGPSHGVPVKDTLDSSVAMYRMHDLDAIRFDRRFRMTFESPWDADRLAPFAHSSVAFFFLDHPQAAPSIPLLDELLCWYRTVDSDHQSIP
ncbi:Protein of unknown function [Microlunatus soli]|uniref:DUF2961 domain-containing protein n=1 Tax=Microlunatus soli TaxID=630515 RepID=A0A1H1U8M0_9ACTN|nr:Protein of unknown function [Microlunatus soli]